MATTPSSASRSAIPSDLELVLDGTRVVSITFGLSLYTDVTFSSVPKAILECFDRFLTLCPADQLRFYATETMKQYKPITKQTLKMLSTWLKPGAPPRKYIALELKDGEQHDVAPHFRFEVYGGEEGSTPFAMKHANVVSMAFPAQWAVDRGAEMLEFVSSLCGVFPARSGHCGFRFECSPYQERIAQTHAWAKSMRYRGVDIYAQPNDKKLVGHDGVHGPSWLTILGGKFVELLGGPVTIRERLSDAIAILPVPGGIILQAGSAPMIGDSNRRSFLPEYKEVYKLIAPLIQFDRSPALLAGDGSSDWDNTLAWMKRLENE